jgi:hypothetical protein
MLPHRTGARQGRCARRADAKPWVRAAAHGPAMAARLRGAPLSRPAWASRRIHRPAARRGDARRAGGSGGAMAAGGIACWAGPRRARACNVSSVGGRQCSRCAVKLKPAPPSARPPGAHTGGGGQRGPWRPPLAGGRHGKCGWRQAVLGSPRGQSTRRAALRCDPRPVPSASCGAAAGGSESAARPLPGFRLGLRLNRCAEGWSADALLRRGERPGTESRCARQTQGCARQPPSQCAARVRGPPLRARPGTPAGPSAGPSMGWPRTLREVHVGPPRN